MGTFVVFFKEKYEIPLKVFELLKGFERYGEFEDDNSVTFKKKNPFIDIRMMRVSTNEFNSRKRMSEENCEYKREGCYQDMGKDYVGEYALHFLFCDDENKDVVMDYLCDAISKQK
jgi:hypothetical protein